ncbi:MAG: hypothetical protein UZ01_00774 [Candidatus Brocadia sinica]|uniref:DUF2927 domain-containing protein n=1 Tax=Candidatus Brocadia sinica JPN1 TaxID=1197129 RepID=A0ABQ0JVL9_9BACT|nr:MULTISPECIES: DUF2927 domain-containing protein [Brocadia]KXK31822.1 MAG: hypothetical protein UZ01_00774 [Candidatus Brocadia sinica]NOG41612.1 DUF2927 domain-containing protein [Planctomycetota bacterium]MCK6469632.1 DUF2927 domain-containing protein [Candidatus Brocadia sinica]NUO07032.1 DUF2927 domain-containing protein [Candidatus Brocadia sinica]GAN32504.1 hypothetical protein BROSI_A1019 [Candidatus Brocadia sinica JPN1]
MITILRYQFLSFLAVIAGFCSVPSASAHPNDRVAHWVEQVILGPEFGGVGKICSRWVKTPRLSIFGASEQQQKVVTDVITHLNETLTKTPIKKIELLKATDVGADIQVYFAPLQDFPSLAKQHKFQYVQDNWGYFWTFWNGRHEIESAFVLLASDKLQGKALQHFALEEITQSLGLSNDSPVFPESIFYAKGNNGGDVQQFSNLDKQLIVFFYNHIQPGATRGEVQAAFKKHWGVQ